MKTRTILAALAAILLCTVPGNARAQEAPEPQAAPDPPARIQTRIQETERQRIREHQPEDGIRLREAQRIQRRTRDAQAREARARRQERAMARQARQGMQRQGAQRSRSRVRQPS